MKVTMRLIIAFFWICIFHLEGYSTTSKFEFHITKADSLLQQKQFALASLNYERAAYHTQNTSEIATALIKKAHCNWQTKNYSDAQRILERINYNGLSDSMAFESQYALAVSAYLNQDFVRAKSELTQISFFIRDPNLVARSKYLMTLTLNELKEWEGAKTSAIDWANSLTNLADTSRQTLIEQIEQLYDPEKSIPRFKDPEKASTLSAFLPGVGQLYAGYFWEGAANVAFQAIGLSIVGVGIYTQYYVTGAVIGLGWFQRFYKGGVGRAEFLANKKNYELMNEFREKTKTILIHNEKERN